MSLLTKEMHLIEPNSAVIKPVPGRDGFGKGLVESSEHDQNIWAITADVCESTRVHWFAEKFPHRFVQVGVAEQNMAGVAAGIAACGKTVFISAFGAFSPGRNWDQIRVSICYSNLPVKIHASHTGLTVGADGASHQMLEDIALMRVLPNMVVVVPADAEETRKAVHAIAKLPGPAYIRTYREKTPVFTTEKTPFEIGRANVYRDGRDIAIVACGAQVYESLVAAERLSKDGIDVAVIDCHTIKPIDHKTIESYAKKTGIFVTVEDHQVNGGLGSAVAEVVASMLQPAQVIRHGVYDHFCESGEAPELLKKYKLDAEGIADVVRAAIKNKDYK